MADMDIEVSIKPAIMAENNAEALGADDTKDDCD
jgi:hypothetical protein